jgi:hypothetical protein
VILLLLIALVLVAAFVMGFRSLRRGGALPIALGAALIALVTGSVAWMFANFTA